MESAPCPYTRLAGAAPCSKRKREGCSWSMLQFHDKQDKGCVYEDQVDSVACVTIFKRPCDYCLSRS